jgi:microcystin-dependent protein
MTWGIGSYSATPGSNTVINGINIAPGCPASSVGPAFRQIMADIAATLAAGQFTPPGEVSAFATAAAPAGYLLCNAQAVNRTTFAALFAAIGTTYGAGDGSTTFNVPGIAGRVIAGYDTGNASGLLTGLTGGVSASTVGNTGGQQVHALTTAELAAHNHTVNITDPGHHHTITGVDSVLFAGGPSPMERLGEGGGNTDTTSIVTNTTGITAASVNTGSGAAHNNVQPTIILLFCIKT